MSEEKIAKVVLSGKLIADHASLPQVGIERLMNEFPDAGFVFHEASEIEAQVIAGPDSVLYFTEKLDEAGLLLARWWNPETVVYASIALQEHYAYDFSALLCRATYVSGGKNMKKEAVCAMLDTEGPFSDNIRTIFLSSLRG